VFSGEQGAHVCSHLASSKQGRVLTYEYTNLKTTNHKPVTDESQTSTHPQICEYTLTRLECGHGPLVSRACRPHLT
jgi:hypothetical protein